MSQAVLRRGAALAAAVGLLVMVVAAWRSDPPRGDGSWRPRFAAPRAPVASELDHRAGRTPSPDWIVTSGTLFSDGGIGWTGDPDGGPSVTGVPGSTGSAVFRAVTQPQFSDCAVDVDLRLDAQVTTPRTPARDYDGVHVFLRYSDPANLYALSVARRDGQVVAKRKVSQPGPPGQESGYVTLASATAPFPLLVWRHVRATVTDRPDGVRLTLEVDDRTLIDVVDEGLSGAPPLFGAGRVGLRGDNTEFHFRSFAVTSS